VYVQEFIMVAKTTGADYTITFDGGSLGNPGKGYGSYELRTATQTKGDVIRKEFGDRQTNNEAEYKTLIAALADVLSRLQQNHEDAKDFTVAVRGDSQLVIYQATSKWKVNTPHIRPLHAEVVRLLAQFKHADLQWHRRANSVRVLGH